MAENKKRELAKGSNKESARLIALELESRKQMEEDHFGKGRIPSGLKYNRKPDFPLVCRLR